MIDNIINRKVGELNLEIESGSYIDKHREIVSQNGAWCDSNSKLLSLAVAMKSFAKSEIEGWLNDNFYHLTKKITSEDEDICISSKYASEIIALGLALETFKDAIALKECKIKKTPDIKLANDKYMEVYCPQESQKEKDKIKLELADQQGMVKVAISHPITGSDGSALTYPSNKVIDKVLNKKWQYDQTIDGAENILWLDLLNGFGLSSIKTLPCESINHGEHTYVGSYGIWHAFYGVVGVSSFAPERTVIKYISPNRNFYKQSKNGMFRDRKSLSAALLLTTDGLILFENPFASRPLSYVSKSSIIKMFRFRPEYSFFGIGDQHLEIDYIDNILTKIEWLYTKNKL